VSSITGSDDSLVSSVHPSNLVGFAAHVGVANRAGYRIVDRTVFLVRRLPGFLWLRRWAVSYARRR
jgi:hypothetical protein